MQFFRSSKSRRLTTWSYWNCGGNEQLRLSPPASSGFNRMDKALVSARRLSGTRNDWSGINDTVRSVIRENLLKRWLCIHLCSVSIRQVLMMSVKFTHTRVTSPGTAVTGPGDYALLPPVATSSLLSALLHPSSHLPTNCLFRSVYRGFLDVSWTTKTCVQHGQCFTTRTILAYGLPMLQQYWLFHDFVNRHLGTLTNSLHTLSSWIAARLFFRKL